MTNQTKTFNKFAKLTIWSTIGAVTFFIISFFVTDWEIIQNVVFFPLKSWGGWYLMSILFWFFYYGAFALLILTPVLGTIASIQTHNKE